MKKLHELLDNDNIFIVLSCIPVKALLGFKCISKEWYNFISTDRSFIKAQMEKTGSLLSGFIFQEKYMWSKEDIKSISYINTPPLDHHHYNHNTRSKSIVHREVFTFLPEDVVVLSSCNGLVCCRSCCSLSSPTKTTLYVCNPTNKDWIALDCLDYDKSFESIVLAFDPYRDPIDISTKFKLVRVKQHVIGSENEEDEDEDEFLHYLTFELYSSETKSWTQSNETCNCNDDITKSPGIYIGGVLYWRIDTDHILTFDLEKELSLIISTPVPHTEFKVIPTACIGEWDRILHYVMVTERGLHVWYLEDYFEAKWELKFWKSLEEIEGEHSQLCCNLKNRVLQNLGSSGNPWMDPLSFKDGVLLMKVFLSIYFYDIEKNITVEAGHVQNLSTNYLPCPTVLPYSLSLVPLKNP